MLTLIDIETGPERVRKFFEGFPVYKLADDDADYLYGTGPPFIVAFDPGEYTGVAITTLVGVYLATLRPYEIAHAFDVVDHPQTWVVERPLSGAVRVYDPTPLEVYGYLKLTASKSSLIRRVDQSPSMLSAGTNLAVPTPGQEVTAHEVDALAHLALFIAQKGDEAE